MKRKVLMVVLFLFAASTLLAGETAKVESFSPQGLVKSVRQVSVRFSEQMAAFGDPRSPAHPFEIQCAVKGSGRWEDVRNWVYDFEGDLPAGVACRFVMKDDVKTLSGKTVLGQKEYLFNTGGPSVRRGSLPFEGNTVDEDQIFILVLDAEPDIESVRRNVFFSIDGIENPVGINVVEGRQRDQLLKAQSRYLSWLKQKQLSSIILIQCRQRFPVETRISLVWGKGVKAKTGVAGEADQVLQFRSRKAFAADFNCARENKDAGCIPVSPMRVYFSAPVARTSAAKIVVQKAAEGKKKAGVERTWKPRLEEDADEVYSVVFDGPFPERTNFLLRLPSGLKDNAGRTLTNANKFPLTVKTAAYPPLAKFSARFGILELKANAGLPVTLRNLDPSLAVRMREANAEADANIAGKIMQAVQHDSMQSWLRKVADAKRSTSLFASGEKHQKFELPKPRGGKAFEVVGIPMRKAGLFIVELESRILGKSLLGKSAPMYVPTAVLVTNLSAHFKWGRESSLVWVTTLDGGKPVKNAAVAIRDCRETILWQGRTDESGIAAVNVELPRQSELPRCYAKEERFADYYESSPLDGLHQGLFVTARTKDDMTFVHSSWDEGIEPWRFQLDYDHHRHDSYAVHTITDRSLLRAGETIHMKHVFRKRTMSGFAMGLKDLPDKAVVEHAGSDEKYELPVKWNAYGSAENSWTIPKEVKLGVYNIVLRQRGDEKQTGKRVPPARRHGPFYSGSFRVEEFRVPLMKGTIQPPAEPLVNAQRVELTVDVHYLAGGATGSLPVKIRSSVRERQLNFKDFPDFSFGGGPVEEGIKRRGAAVEEEEGETGQEQAPAKARDLPVIDLMLDKSGAASVTLAPLPATTTPKNILTEMEFTDPNGEVQTVSAAVPLWPSSYAAGLQPDEWASARDNLGFKAAVVDLRGRPVAGAKVDVDAYQRKFYSHRKRLVGGFYAYEHVEETRKIAPVCSGKTDARGFLLCHGKSPVSGNIILAASTADPEGRRAYAQSEIWVADKDDWWFDVSDNDRIDLLPGKKTYSPGEKAVFQVRMPFREATVLVSVEREGVMESWVKKISGKHPVIEVPVKNFHAPNVFVSVLVVRGRVPGVVPTALVDMGKPAYKLGIAEINVGWQAHELKVAVAAEKEVYKVRQKAKVKVKVTAANGTRLPAGSEIALAAVDEGLLELMPNASWNLLSSMMGRRPYEVATASAQMQVIGKRHFGLKALPAGGGGGAGKGTRELFDTLLLWRGRIVLDENGEASAEIPLNDSITSFRIVAVATGGAGMFGAGSASIRTTQDVMIFAGLPPLVREGDRYAAAFTLRNTTARVIDAEVAAKAPAIRKNFSPLSVTLSPGESRIVEWGVTAPAGIDSIRWEVEIKEAGGGESDRIRVTQQVIPVTPVKTYQATIVQLDQKFRMEVQRPREAAPGRGGINVIVKPTIVEGLSGVRDYMKHYPYSCLEQKVSMAVALRDGAVWKRIMDRLPSYLDGRGFAKFFPSCTDGSEVLTAYILAIAQEAGWQIPDSPKDKMQGALKGFISGKFDVRPRLATADLNIRKLSAIEALARDSQAEPAMINAIAVEPNLWPTSAVIDWHNILQRVSSMPDRSRRIAEAQQILRSRLDFQGTKMGFSTDRSDVLWWLMVSGDVNAVRAVLSLKDAAAWREDIPRMVVGALSRQRRGAWDLTLANAWGVLAMEKFAAVFEKAPVSGTTRAVLEDKPAVIDWQKSRKGATRLFAWPAARTALTAAHEGSGRPWLTVQSTAAVPLKSELSSGYRIRRTVSPVERKRPGAWSAGDVLRIRLEIEAQADQTWVVVSDPVPAGSTILGKGLARDSQLLTGAEKDQGWYRPAFEERSFEALRAYYEYAPKGKWTVEYTIRLNAGGTFHLPPTRVEALYFPEMFGELPNETMQVKQ